MFDLRWLAAFFPFFSLLVLHFGARKELRPYFSVMPALLAMTFLFLLWAVRTFVEPQRLFLILILLLNVAAIIALLLFPVRMQRRNRRLILKYEERLAPVQERCQDLLASYRDLDRLIEKTIARLNQIVSRYVLAKVLASHFEEEAIFAELDAVFARRKEMLDWFYGEVPDASGWKILRRGKEKESRAQGEIQDWETLLAALPEVPAGQAGRTAGGASVPVNESRELVLSLVRREEGRAAVLGALVPREESASAREDLSVYSQILALSLRRSALFARLEERSRRDGLTGLYLRRILFERIRREMGLSRRYGTSFSVIMMDLDHFKRVNDLWGHLAGDAVLRGFADALRSCLHPGVTLCRYGGEEFVALIGLAPREEVMRMAETIRRTTEEHDFRFENKRLSVRVSLGVAHYAPDITDPQTYIERADQALYSAKQAGRNRVAEWKK